MKILILTHYFPPEIGAPQARLYEMGKSWVALGHDVGVLTCFPNHPTGSIPKEYQGKTSLHETMDGISILRTWVYATPNTGFVKKTLGHLSFMFSSVIQGWRFAKKYDVILVSSPTFFSVISAWKLSFLFRIPYIFEVRDLWPAIFVELGVLKNRLLIRILEAIELFLYRHAAQVVTVTHSFADFIEKLGIPKTKLSVITNGVDLTFFSPRNKDDGLLKKLNLEGKFIVMYIGAHGISHSLHRIIEVAETLVSTPAVHFLFVGEGADKPKIMELANQKNLKNITFLPGQPKHMVPNFYSIMDVGLVPLRNIPLFDTFIPSKMFEMMGMGKPIIASVHGEAEGIAKASNGALITDPENVEGISQHILTLYANPDLCQQLGQNGLAFSKANYDRSVLASRYIDIIQRILQ